MESESTFQPDPDYVEAGQAAASVGAQVSNWYGLGLKREEQGNKTDPLTVSLGMFKRRAVHVSWGRDKEQGTRTMEITFYHKRKKELKIVYTTATDSSVKVYTNEGQTMEATGHPQGRYVVTTYEGPDADQGLVAEAFQDGIQWKYDSKGSEAWRKGWNSNYTDMAAFAQAQNKYGTDDAVAHTVFAKAAGLLAKGIAPLQAAIAKETPAAA